MTGLREDDWLAIEELNDLICSAEDSGSVLTSALEFVLSKLGCPAGAIYLPGLGGKYEWISYNAPQTWQTACQDENTQLSGLIRRALYQSIPMPGIDSLQLGAIFPLLGVSDAMGIVLVSPSAAEDNRWHAYLRALARIVTLHKRNVSSSPYLQETEVLRILSEAQNTIDDPDKLTLQMAMGIRDVFQAEDSILILLDEESPDLVICKRLGLENREGWFSQYSVRLGSKFVHWMVNDYHVLTLDDIYAEPELGILFRGETDLQVDVITCSPLKGNSGQIIGALILVNPPVRNMDDSQPDLLATATSHLANLIHTSRLITLLKISNADLEALRWELTNSRNTLRALFDSLPSSVYIVDQVYNLVAINLSRSGRVNQHPSALVGRKCYEKLHGRMEPCKGCQVADTLRSGNSTQRYSRELGNDDSYHEWDVKTFSVHDNPDKPARAIVVEEDITAHRSMETNLAHFEKMAVIGQLATGIAQELHDPLTAILANAQVLKHFLPKNQSDWQESIELIESAGKDIFQVTQNLLGIAQKGKYQFLPCDLNDTVFNAQNLLQHEIKSRQVNVRMALEENMPKIIVSKDHLQDVWINLLLTSMESLDKEQKWIEICSYYEQGWYHLTFQDNGKGIQPDQTEKLFDPPVNGKRSGLNLYNCKKVVRQHGGNLEVESRVGEWTRYIVTLPAQSSEVVVKERSRVREFEPAGIR